MRTSATRWPSHFLQLGKLFLLVLFLCCLRIDVGRVRSEWEETG